MGIFRQHDFHGPFVCVGECADCGEPLMYAVTAWRATWSMHGHRIRRDIEPYVEWLMHCDCVTDDDD